MDSSVPRGQISGVATPPCSKSYAQRALAAALLAEGETVLRNLDFCDDTLSAIRVIETLGAEVERLDERTVKVRGGLNPKSNIFTTIIINTKNIIPIIFKINNKICSILTILLFF